MHGMKEIIEEADSLPLPGDAMGIYPRKPPNSVLHRSRTTRHGDVTRCPRNLSNFRVSLAREGVRRAGDQDSGRRSA